MWNELMSFNRLLIVMNINLFIKEWFVCDGKKFWNLIVIYFKLEGITKNKLKNLLKTLDNDKFYNLVQWKNSNLKVAELKWYKLHQS